jgi:hypothetical protein
MIINHRRILHLFTINFNFSSKDRLSTDATAATIGIRQASLSALEASSAHRRARRKTHWQDLYANPVSRQLTERPISSPWVALFIRQCYMVGANGAVDFV